MMESKTKSTPKHRLQKLNTKGCCFLCLKIIHFKTEESSNKNNTSEVRRSVSLKCLRRYLKINAKVLLPQNPSVVPKGCNNKDDGGDSDSGDIVADLCVSCAKIINKISKLYQSFEKTQLEINHWIEKIHSEITEAAKLPELVQNYSKRMTSDPETLTQLVFVDHLRKEIARKSTPRKTDLKPRLYLRKLENIDKYLTSSHLKSVALSLASSPDEEKPEEDFEDDDSLPLLEEEYENKLDMITLERNEETNVQSNAPLHNTPQLSQREQTDSTASGPSHRPSSPLVSLQEMYFKSSKTGLYSCSGCNKKFSSQWNLTSHYKSIHLRKRHPCDQCKRDFASQLGLRKHQNTCHYSTKALKSVRKSYFNPKTGKYGCTVCNKELADRSGIKAHYDNVHLKKKHKCDICNVAVYSQQANLIAHRKICKSLIEKRLSKALAKEADPNRFRFVCPKAACKKRFDQKDRMELHFKMVHLKERNFCCDICKRKYSSISNLNDHKKRVHFGRRFSCKFCNGKYVSRQKQQQHEQRCRAATDNMQIKIETTEVGRERQIKE